ncbi:hypothetical protein ACVWW1_002933 [Bradyrhizobium sp. JR3.5]
MSDHPDSTATQNVNSASRATDRRTQDEKPSTILLNSSDDVLIALRAIAVGETVSDGVVRDRSDSGRSQDCATSDRSGHSCSPLQLSNRRSVGYHRSRRTRSRPQSRHERLFARQQHFWPGCSTNASRVRATYLQWLCPCRWTRSDAQLYRRIDQRELFGDCRPHDRRPFQGPSCRLSEYRRRRGADAQERMRT